ncbi:ricin-type beta-trefoil lectin domain protein [Streptomyces roseicoloratus]|uniref:Ricin-type beta-trefoil lectin domain protein n=1 Tax=Streptomyces roseicoloratus TaxID=2508722 RepID=A0ABY9S0P3_9ACTN|nr:ricin-type beta-trefoil lectin domain protein [Streptomyces roseicoloratus]WMX46665.1 ricin-type beta-trefoil lectin domain protein [Streptomyces roseicoloratus]
MGESITVSPLFRLRRALACGLAAAVLATGLNVGLAAPAQAAVDKTCGTPAAVGGGNCVTALINAGFEMIKLARKAANNNKLDNAQFTQHTATKLAEKFPGFNVLVFKTSGTDLYDIEWFKNKYEADMKGVLLDTTFKLNHFLDKEQRDPSGYDKFRIWVFQGESTFRNHGDGGYMNWAFIGNDSDTVKNNVRTLHFPARPGMSPRTGSLTPDSAAPGYHACLDVSGNNSANGTPVQMWECNGGDAQRWTYNGYKLRAANGKCLDLAGNKAANGTKLQVWDCLDIPGQRWHMSPSGGLRHMTDLNDRSRDVCIDNFDGRTANGGAVVAWACGSEDRRDAPNQNWAWGGTPPTTAPGNGADVILKLDNGLGAVPVSGSAGAAVVPGIRGGNESKWKLTSVGGGRYRITSSYGLELTESSGYMAELRPWSNSSKQKWELHSVGNGRVQIRISDDDCLTHNSDFKQLGVWTCKSGWKFEWVLESATGGVIVPGDPAGPTTPTNPSTGGGGGSGIPTDRPLFLKLANGLGATAPNETASWGAPILGGILGYKGSTWTIKPLGGDRYRIVNDLGYNLTENPETYVAEQQAWGNTSNQKWQFKSVGNGKYRIQISDDDCLTHDSDHKQLGVWTCEGGWKQEWSFQLH